MYNSGAMNLAPFTSRLAVLLLSLLALACRPVLAIGWGELLIFLLLLLLAFGLPLWRFWRKRRAFQKENKREKD